MTTVARKRSQTAGAYQARARKAFAFATRCINNARASKRAAMADRVTFWAATARTYNRLGRSYRRSAASERRRVAWNRRYGS